MQVQYICSKFSRMFMFFIFELFSRKSFAFIKIRFVRKRAGVNVSNDFEHLFELFRQFFFPVLTNVLGNLQNCLFYAGLRTSATCGLGACTITETPSRVCSAGLRIGFSLLFSHCQRTESNCDGSGTQCTNQSNYQNKQNKTSKVNQVGRTGIIGLTNIYKGFPAVS